MSKLLLTLAAIILGVGSPVVHAENVAPTWLSDCTSWKSSSNPASYAARCLHGSSYFQATAQCYGAAGIRYDYGPIRATGLTSTGYCDTGYTVIKHGWREVS